MKFTPHKYQQEAVKFLVSHPEAALLLDPGLGKSAVTLAAFLALKKAKAARKALIIAPLRVAQLVWSHGGEVGKWDEFKHLKVALLHGPDKDSAVEEDADLYVINYDGLPWLVNNGHLVGLVKRGVDVLVYDELSKMKHVKTKRVKLLKPHLGRFKRRWGLTGSPASNGLLDLFGQAYVLDLGRALGRYITHYRFKYFLPTGYGGYTWVLQKGAEEQIYEALKPLALSMRAKDHLDLPQLVERPVWVNLPDAARKIYDTMEADLVAQVDGGLVTAANAAVASGKCRQVASGGLYVMRPSAGQAKLGHTVPDVRTSVVVHDAKTEALVDLVEELQGSPALVAYEFDHDLERIRDALGKVPAINGQSSGKETMELVTAWNRGDLPVLACHPASVGHGLNMQESGHHIIWYSLTWNMELYDQTVRRIYRQGAKAKRVIVHHILARKTVDEVIAKVLVMKKRTQEALFAALKELHHG